VLPVLTVEAFREIEVGTLANFLMRPMFAEAVIQGLVSADDIKTATGYVVNMNFPMHYYGQEYDPLEVLRVTGIKIGDHDAQGLLYLLRENPVILNLFRDGKIDRDGLKRFQELLSARELVRMLDIGLLQAAQLEPLLEHQYYLMVH
jgi:hypothetical protein